MNMPSLWYAREPAVDVGVGMGGGGGGGGVTLANPADPLAAIIIRNIPRFCVS